MERRALLVSTILALTLTGIILYASEPGYSVDYITYAADQTNGWSGVPFDEGGWQDVGAHYANGLSGYFRIHISGEPGDGRIFLRVGDCIERAFYDGSPIFINSSCKGISHRSGIYLPLPRTEGNAEHVLAIKTVRTRDMAFVAVDDGNHGWSAPAAALVWAVWLAYVLAVEYRSRPNAVMEAARQHWTALAAILLFAALLAHFSLQDIPMTRGLGDVRLADSVDVGDFVSEAVHGYWVNGDMRHVSYWMDSPDEERVIDEDGIAYNGTEYFDVSAAPGKDLTMVKLAPSKPAPPDFMVYVNERFVGVLKDPLGVRDNNHGIWEYLKLRIPGKYVNDSRVRIRVEAGGGQTGLKSFGYFFYLASSPAETAIIEAAKAAIWSILAVGFVLAARRLWLAGYASVVLFLCSAALLCWFAYYVQGVPHTGDDLTPLFHARMFAEGRLYYDSPPLPQFFRMYGMVNSDGKWYSIFDPGHMLVLVPGVLAGIPWIINPLLGALTVAVAYHIGKEAYDERVGLYAALLGGVSPMLIVISSTMLRHVPTMAFIYLFILSYILAQKRKDTRLYALSAVFAGFAFITRAYTTVALLLPFAAYHAYMAVKDGSLRKPTALMAAVLGLFLAAYMAYSFTLTGNPFLTPGANASGMNTPGLGPQFGDWTTYGTYGHTLSKGLANAKIMVIEADQNILGWSFIPFALVLFAYSRKNRWDLLFGASILSLLGAYVLFWGSGDVYPGRYFSEAAFMAILLVARSIGSLGERRDAVFLGVFALSLVCAYTVLSIHLDFYANYVGVSATPLRVVDNSGIRDAVVFTDDLVFPSVASRELPSLDGDIVYAIDRGADEDKKLMRLYPGRGCYQLAGANQSYALTECDLQTSGKNGK